MDFVIGEEREIQQFVIIMGPSGPSRFSGRKYCLWTRQPLLVSGSKGTIETVQQKKTESCIGV
jgi:hypothetical protein